MDSSVAVGVLVYLTLLILCAVSVVHQTTRLIDLAQAVASNRRTERVSVEVLDSEASMFTNEKCQERFSGQGS